ncbi:hypothetical protein LPB136_12190 [Tenacibaculum todarodis]|uniref:Uncharacterized protein n=1 Tax=Tenacibaculum todarodis TaxID=1850252 RepID=A0A1L3JLV7_9FLAO|nr:hypothetical protein [Tenacibaculum todarodis]APG66082.1 hypothetical protein LPB136_12190 [Tenacibaculum todarodis]
MKKIILVLAFVFASGSLVNAETLINNTNLESPPKLKKFRIKVDCDGDGIFDYDMTGNFTEENANAMAVQMQESC